MKAWGVTTLKLYVGMTRPVGKRIIEEGKRHGLVVTGHLGRYSAQDAVADGIDSLEHIWSVFNFILPPPPDTPLARLEARANADLNSPKAQELIAAIASRKVAVGPNLVVFRNMLLLHDLLEIQNDPDHATVPARLRAHWDDYRRRTLGSISNGKLAELVLLDADPLTDIRNTRKIFKVFRSGVASDPKALLKTVPVN